MILIIRNQESRISGLETERQDKHREKGEGVHLLRGAEGWSCGAKEPGTITSKALREHDSRLRRETKNGSAIPAQAGLISWLRVL